jgi:Tfp pilus assembly protein PilX
MRRHKNEEGSVLVIALVILVLLTVIGISASRNTAIELQISGNEKFHKMAFYAADGGTEVGAELLEQNIEQRQFDTSTVGSVVIENSSFWSKLTSGTTDAYIPNVSGGRVELEFYGNSQLSTGGAIQLISGYEGKGKGAGGSGAFLVHVIRSHAQEVARADSRVMTNWRHVI